MFVRHARHIGPHTHNPCRPRLQQVIIQREHENRLFAQLSALGFAPLYLGRFSNGRVEGFMEARVSRVLIYSTVHHDTHSSFLTLNHHTLSFIQPLTPEEMAQTTPIDIAGLIAQELARMHAMQVAVPGEGAGTGGGGKRTAVLWGKMEQWARLAEGALGRVSFFAPNLVYIST